VKSERDSGAGQQSVLRLGLRRFLGLALASADMNPSHGCGSGQSVVVTGLRRILGLALASAARMHSSRGSGEGQQNVLRFGLRRILGLALASAALLSAPGCPPPREGLPSGELCAEIRDLSLPDASVSADNTFESSPFHAGYVEVAPDECARFPITPALPAPPRLVQVYTAFQAPGGGDPEFITPTPATGDAALLVEDAEDGVVLRNLTGTRFLYRVVAR
jgi:hypothetical protein